MYKFLKVVVSHFSYLDDVCAYVRVFFLLLSLALYWKLSFFVWYVIFYQVQSRARKQIGEFGKSVVDLEMMPISSNQAKELSDALMGEQDEKVYSKDSIVGLPNPAQLVRSLKLQLRKRENTVLNFGISTEFHLFWPLIIKAEIHPLFTALEGILSWIVLMSCKFHIV